MVQREILTGGERGGGERRKGEREKHVVLNSEQVPNGICNWCQCS